MKTQEIIISGKVQGVGFRYSALAKAEELDIHGFAKNLPNGDVLIEAESVNENSLSLFLQWCKKGPALASVKNVQTNKIISKHYKNFTIR